ncbi:MAG: hypothetical protein LBT84_00785 [Spirochaetia bacterium]|jgi:hypothetical protein|nr:hypothetical protein [Spirochaetia bacterium]
MSTNNEDIQKMLSIGKRYDLDRKSDVNINETHTPFEGFLHARPSDNGVLLLFYNPFSVEEKFYEFSIDSIAKIDDLGKVTNENGETANKIRVWVKKGMPAIISESFVIK